MKRTWTIIGVNNVGTSFTWYQSLFGQSATGPEHDYFGQLLDSDGTVLLCLHAWGAHEHPSLMTPDRATPGNGLLLFFRVDDFDKSLQRARDLVPQFDEEPCVKPQHSNSRVHRAGPRRILRHDQRALTLGGSTRPGLVEMCRLALRTCRATRGIQCERADTVGGRRLGAPRRKTDYLVGP